MTLYGLDLMQDPQGKYHLLEINGVCSGMRGFEIIYGDNRVEEKVHQMLQQRYGKVTLNDGSYARLQYKKEHPVGYVWYSMLKKLGLFPRQKPSPFFHFPSARVSWLNEKVPISTDHPFPLESYLGQESAVVSPPLGADQYHEKLPHPLVNPYLTEAIAANKFFTYQVLKNSAVRDLIPPATLLGLGFTHEQELADLIEKYDSFVIKPTLGSRGRGLEFISKETAKIHQHTRGPIQDVDALTSMYGKPEDLLYVEDLAKKDIFSFQIGLGIIQPFIPSAQLTDSETQVYQCIRAIVCNERFVDAYARVSLTKKANLAQGATPCPYTEKDEIASLSEKIIAVFEEECFRYEPENFRQELYGQYITSRGQTTSEMRKGDLNRGLGGLFSNLAESLTARLP